MVPWFSKTEGNTYATLLHHPFLFKEIQRSAQEVAVWQGQEDVEPLQNAKDKDWLKLKTLHFYFSDPRSH